MKRTRPVSSRAVLAPHEGSRLAPMAPPRLPRGPEFSEPLHQYADLLRPYSDRELWDLEMVARLSAYRRRVRT